jgi:hypothetical protein
MSSASSAFSSVRNQNEVLQALCELVGLEVKVGDSSPLPEKDARGAGLVDQMESTSSNMA